MTDGRQTPGRPLPGEANRPLMDPNQLLPHGKAVVFDLETTGARSIFIDPIGSHVRIGGWAVGGGSIHLDPTMTRILDQLRVAGILAGHNLLGYDLIALHVHHGFPSPFQLLEKGIIIHDTQLAEVILDPPEARMGSGEASRYYNLDQVANRHGFGGKSLDLGKFARHYANKKKESDPEYRGEGFELIPLDNPDYLHYLRQDVDQTRKLARRQAAHFHDPYMLREHRIAAIAAQMTINGTRVDKAELNRRVQNGRRKRAALLGMLHERYGLPRADRKGKPYKSPQMTKEGKLAIVTAFDDAGVPMDEFKAKERSGMPDLGQDYMKWLMDQYIDHPKVVALAETVMELNGVRTIYDNVQEHLAGDRVHPTIIMRQASGRWSLTNPGMTVIGKRDGRVKEREVFLADPGEVMLSVDLSQVDARAVAAWCQDPNYMALFDEGRDIWTEMAHMFGISRNAVKVISHGSNYGMGVAGTLRHNPSLTLEQVEAFHQGRREQFPLLLQWQDRVREQGSNNELLENGFGRKLRVDPNRSYTQSPALIGQSTARDIMMEGLLNLDPSLHMYLRLLIHDEVVLSVPKESAQEIAKEVVEALSFPWAPPGASDPIMIRAEASIGDRTWASTYEKEGT